MLGLGFQNLLICKDNTDKIAKSQISMERQILNINYQTRRAARSVTKVKDFLSKKLKFIPLTVIRMNAGHRLYFVHYLAV